MATRQLGRSTSREDVQAVGFYLLQNFIQEEFKKAELSTVAIEINPPEIFEKDDDIADDVIVNQSTSLASSSSHSSLLERLSDPTRSQNFQDCGATLQIIASHFEKNHERFLVNLLSRQVPLTNISYQDFSDLLRELFKHGVSESRIVALFFFCSDVLIRCVKNGLGSLGRKLFAWAVRFLFGNVCQWVYENGGWERVFSNVYKVARRVTTITALTVITLCGIVFLKNNWK